MNTGATSLAHATVQIFHRFDLTMPSAFVRRADSKVDLPRAVAHIQFMAQHWFGRSALVTNQGVARALTELYGFEPAVPSAGEELDIFATVVALTAAAHDVMSDPMLYREGLRNVIKDHLVL